jgi:hypothetical protein
MSATVDRLTDLEQRITALEAQAVADTLQPNVITVAANGEIGAAFTGLLNALGLIIPPAASPSYGLQNSITWQRQSDGAQAAFVQDGIFTDVLSGRDVDQLVISTDRPSGVQGELITLNTENLDLTLDDQASNGGISTVQISTAGGHLATLFNSSGQSSFPQLDQTRASKMGTLTLTWPGGTSRSNSTNLAFGYPTGMIIGGAYATDNGTAVTCGWGLFGAGVNVFGITGDGHAPAAGVQCTASYLAWF